MKLHTDWPPLLNMVPRSFNVKGPRVGKGNTGYAPWPPRLVEGENVAKWETTETNLAPQSVIFISELVGRKVRGEDVYDRDWMAKEMNPAHPQFNQWRSVRLQWSEAIVTDGKHPDHGLPITRISPNHHSPSAIQAYSRQGSMILAPRYSSRWKWGVSFNLRDPRGFFWRFGWRPDHVDAYYNNGPFVGLKGE